jgi:hypothetical protein
MLTDHAEERASGLPMLDLCPNKGCLSFVPVMDFCPVCHMGIVTAKRVKTVVRRRLDEFDQMERMLEDFGTGRLQLPKPDAVR